MKVGALSQYWKASLMIKQSTSKVKLASMPLYWVPWF